MRIDTYKLALAGGIYGALLGGGATILALLGMPGFPEFTGSLVRLYGFYGYSVSWVGVIVGAFWGFVELFLHLAVFAWIYNKVAK